jgi:putative hydrolase of the HAD superfamily
MIPSIVVFDLGKVLVDFDYSIAARKIAAQCEVSPVALKEFIDHSPLLFRYETGHATRAEFYEEVREFGGFRGTFEQFCSDFGGIFTPIPPMVKAQAALRERGVPTYIFSNTNDLAIEDIRSKFTFYENFDGYILSYEVGAMKPNPKIYEALEKMSGRRGSEICYFDDRSENVEAGSARGWHAIVHEKPEASIAALKRLGLLDHDCPVPGSFEPSRDSRA